MRQVPHITRYAIIGRGKIARHFSHYFSLLDLNFWVWEDSRSLSEDFFARFHDPKTAPTHVWILVSDSAIEPIARRIRERLGDRTPILLHASGVLETDQAIGAHPLYTFGPELYRLETYEKIPFFVSRDASLENLPMLSNPLYRLPSFNRSLYHALAVVAGNFPLAIWASVFEKMENELGIPREAARPYLTQVLENAFRSQSSSAMFTGPRVRGDTDTIEKHLKALEGDDLKKVYQSIDTFITERVRKENPNDHRT